MSDSMLLGCLRMPIELYPEGMSKESAIFITQQQSRCIEAADRIEQLKKENERLKKHYSQIVREAFTDGYDSAECGDFISEFSAWVSSDTKDDLESGNF